MNTFSAKFTGKYAVIFTSRRTEGDNGYSEMADLMVELASQQTGFLGVDSARQEVGITVSYWEDEASIRAWYKNAEHNIARDKGRSDWYTSFETYVCKIERAYSFLK